MKPSFLFALALVLLAAPLNAQHAFFPLHVGDTWQYYQLIVDPGHVGVDVKQTTVLGDTVMPNGHHYAVLSDWGYPEFIRQEGDSVFFWSPYGEWLYFDFSRAPGDTIITNEGRPGDTVFVATTARDTLTVFGSRRCTWQFGFDDPHTVDEERMYTVVDSIGITDIYFSFGGGYNFQGARVNGVVYGNLTSVDPPASALPGNFTLAQNYPNPFNPSTTIRYSSPHRSHVTLTVFNTLGQRVATVVDRDVEAGYHEEQFNASNLASGVYFYRLQAPGFVQTRTLLLVR